MQSRFYRPCVMMSCLETFQPLPPPAQSSKNYHVQINSPPHSTQHTPPQYSPFSSNTPQSPSAASPETKYHSPPPQQVSSSPAKAETPPPNPVPAPPHSEPVPPAAAPTHTASQANTFLHPLSRLDVRGQMQPCRRDPLLWKYITWSLRRSLATISHLSSRGSVRFGSLRRRRGDCVGRDGF